MNPDLSLSHYSKALTLKPRSCAQHPAIKPQGLWLSVDGPWDWKAWCECENFWLETLANRFVITLRRNARILYISTVDGLDWVNERAADSGVYDINRFGAHYIDWERVAGAYRGIIIAPYLWEARLDPRYSWYYGWDCASGCIWDAKAIAAVRLDECGHSVAVPESDD